MYVDKAFGDAIQKGADPVKVRARIVEIDTDNGMETDAPALTSRITVSGENLTVTSGGMEGVYMTALASADMNTEFSQGKVIFTFTGAGGVFHETVQFRLLGEPVLEFPEEGSDGSWTVGSYNPEMDLIAGSNVGDKIRFYFRDAVEEPERIEFDTDDGLSAVAEQDKRYQFTYYAIVQNGSQLLSDKEDIFVKPKQTRITVRGIFKNGMRVENFFYINLYPEGISVDSKAVKDGRLTVNAYTQEFYYGNDTEATERFVPTTFKLTVAFVAGEKAVINTTGEGVKFKDLTGKDEANKNVAAKYKKKISGNNNGEYAFCPEDMLYESKVPYNVELPVAVSAQGTSFEREIPILLVGKGIDPMEDWQAEYDRLIFRIKKFVPPEQWHDALKAIKTRNETGRMSIQEMRLMSKDILQKYMDYWLSEQAANNRWCTQLDWMIWGLEWTKWIGDQAFSFVVSAYAGPVVEAVVSPAKDIVTEALGVVGTRIFWGEQLSWEDFEGLEFTKAIKSGFDNLAWNAASGALEDIKTLNPANIKKAAGIIAGYYAFSVFNNYMEIYARTGETDFWGAVTGAFKDLTLNAFKTAASALFKGWLKSDKFKDMMQSKVGKYIKDSFEKFARKVNFDYSDKTMQTMLGKVNELQDLHGDLAYEGATADIKMDEIIEKYVTEILGERYEKIEEKFESSDCFFNVNDELMFRYPIWEPVSGPTKYITINLTRQLQNLNGLLFGYLYEAFFAGVPSAPAVIDVPVDPPLYDKGMTKS